MGLFGCGTRNSNSAVAQKTSRAKQPLVFHIGHQKADGLNLLKLRGDLEKRFAPLGVTVEWVNFPAGPQLLEALGVGSLDFGSTGDSPAIFAQAAGIPLVYVANIPLAENSADAQAILVPKDSPIRTVTDLKGKKIAFQKASGAHNMLIQIIEKAGLKYSDIQPVYLAPPDARAAFDSGSVDAWAIWDPYLAAAQQKTQARILANQAGVLSAGAFYLSSSSFARAHPDLLKIVLEEVDKVSAWAAANPKEAAKLLADNTGIDLATLELLQSRRPKGTHNVGVRPIDERIIQAQQTVADNYYRIGLLPKKVNVREAMLTPEQYAKLTPAHETGSVPR